MHTSNNGLEKAPSVMIKHKILLHLLSLDEQMYVSGHMPFESTQDGIAKAIGITRGHCCQVIRKI